MSRPGTGRKGIHSSRGSMIPRTARTETGVLTTGGVGVALSTQMNVEMRPVTREGMLAVGVQKEGLEDRRVKGVKYWESLLRKKCSELEDEIAKFKVETQTLNKDSERADSLINKKEVLQSELQSLDQTFRDWNLAVEKLQQYPDDPSEEIDKETEELINENQKMKESINEVVKMKIDKNNQLNKVDRKIKSLRQQFEEKLVQNPRLKEEFDNLQRQEQQLDEEIKATRGELLKVESQFQQLSAEIKTNPEKANYLNRLKEKMENVAKLHKIEADIREIENEGENEKARMQRMKQEVTQMKLQINRLTQDNEELREKVNEKKKIVQEFTGDKAKGFQKLLDHEKKIMEYLKSYPKEKKSVENDLADQQGVVVDLLDHISQGIDDKDLISKSSDKLNTMEENLKWKQEEFDRSQSTFQKLQVELQKREKELETMKNLDKRLETDYSESTLRIKQMTASLEIYNDLDTLERDYKQLKTEMETYKSDQLVLREAMKKQMNSMSMYHKFTSKKLAMIDAAKKLNALHDKIRNYENRNYFIQDYVMTKGHETDYSRIKKHCLDLAIQINKLIKEDLVSNPDL